MEPRARGRQHATRSNSKDLKTGGLVVFFLRDNGEDVAGCVCVCVRARKNVG